jgi:molecular chaperone HtpG
MTDRQSRVKRTKRRRSTVTKTTAKETFGFQTEAKQLLNLMINSVYSNKEVFLRELVSNGSDACDKLRFEALSNSALFENEQELTIRIGYDVQARTVTVTDNGIGMSRQEVVEHIGTIARSGTQEFLQKLTGDQTQDTQLIGQFGVGFYSTFVVAERVTLVTRRAGLTAEHGVSWESTGEGEYTLETVQKETRGTEVILHLRQGEDALLSSDYLRDLIRKYSDHIAMPIIMQKEGTDESSENEKVNQASALWARPKSGISEEQYQEFYKHVAHDFEPALAYTHAKVEGRQEYTVLLFVPQRAPFDLWDRAQWHGIKLYVRRVFIMDDAEQLMPAYLRFVRGVVDSNDLPLNLSRELLQHSQDVAAIRMASVKRVLGTLEKLAKNDSVKYAKFWHEFGRVFKEGIGEDAPNRKRVAKLLRFASTHADTDDQSVGLADYVGRMKDGQDKIYYIAAESFTAAHSSPHLEIFRKTGIEVILLHDRVDEWVVSHLIEFEGQSLQSVSKGDLDLETLGELPDPEKQQHSETEYTSLLERMQNALKPRTEHVRLTSRLTDSPACLVSDHGPSMNLERILKEAGQAVPMAQPVMEINPEHPLIRRLRDETDDERFSDWTRIIFDQALLAEGGKLDNPAEFVKRLNTLMLALAGGERSRIWTPGN